MNENNFANELRILWIVFAVIVTVSWCKFEHSDVRQRFETDEIVRFRDYRRQFYT